LQQAESAQAELLSSRPKLQELLFDLSNYKENLRDSQTSLKKQKEQYRQLEEEFSSLQIEH
jgi:uncharacterized protein (DUF3084 family)